MTDITTLRTVAMARDALATIDLGDLEGNTATDLRRARDQLDTVLRTAAVDAADVDPVAGAAPAFQPPAEWPTWGPEAKTNAVDLQMTRQEMVRDLLVLSGGAAAGEVADDPYLASEDLARLLVRLGGPSGALADVLARRGDVEGNTDAGGGE